MKSNEALDRLRADVYIAQRFRRELEALAGEDFRATVLEARRVWMDENPCEDGHDHETPFDRFLYGYRDQTASSCSHTDSGRYIEVHTLEAAQPTLYATPAPAMLNGVEPTREHIVAFKQASHKCAQDYDDHMSPEYRGLEAVFRMLRADGNRSEAERAQANIDAGWYARRDQHARDMGYAGLAAALDDLEQRRVADNRDQPAVPAAEVGEALDDIDTMRDVYMSRAQREAYDRIKAAALSQPAASAEVRP